MRVLVLGSTGFVGRHVARELASRGHAVVGWSRTRTGDAAFASEREIDLSDASALAGVNERCDAAIMLAGMAVPGPHFDAASAAINAHIARNALEHLARNSRGARVVVMSSAHVYGGIGDEMPFDEGRALAPSGLYGASKIEVERLARAHADELGVVIVRSFNQIGPRMPSGLLIPDLLVKLRATDGVVAMNGPDGVRDFLDVRDGARAIADLASLELARGSVFNLCSGRGVRVRDLAERLARRLALRREFRFAAGAPAPLIGSRDALSLATGWMPRHDLDATLDWIAEETAQQA